MKQIRNFMLLALLFNYYSKVFSQNASIIGGGPITIEEVPFQVSIEKNQNHHCGGVILNPEWILTAAHCLVEDVEYIVHAGATDQTNNNIGQRIIVDAKHTHTYDPTTRINDIALLHLSKPLCFDNSVQAIELPSAVTNLSIGDPAYISGYGASGGGHTGILKGATTEIISNEQAENIFTNANNNGTALCPTVDITNSMIAFYKSGTQASNGDSGGPATITQNGNKILIGITNFGCNAVTPPNTLPSIYANVKEHLPFIMGIIGQYNSSNDFIVNSNATINQKFIPVDIIVTQNGILNITGELYFKNQKGIYIQEGGKVILSGNAKLDKCPFADGTWKGIEIQKNGELEVINGTILNASKSVFAKTGSTLNSENLVIEGQNYYTNTGIEIEPNVNTTLLKNITINNVRQGVYSHGENNLVTLQSGTIANSIYPITFSGSTVIIDDYHISNSAYDIRLINSVGSIVKNSTLGSSQLGIVLSGHL